MVGAGYPVEMRAATQLMAGAGVLLLAVAGGGTRMAAADTANRAAGAAASICTAPAGRQALAARLSGDMLAALDGRSGRYAVTVYDRVSGITCQLNQASRFDSASVVKATILAALLRWHQETGRPLSEEEQELATQMITQSDNDAASDLWDELGSARIQHFLDLAGMTQTQLGPGGYWGLSQVTAHDELILLQLLTAGNPVLNRDSRSYELGLMARVIPSQSWGVPAGAPAGVTVHVKNGWLPDTNGWHINSIGAFTGHGRNYMMAVLSDGNPSMDYGVATVEAVARVVNRDLDVPLPALAAPLAATLDPVAAGPEPSASAVVPALPLFVQPSYAVVPALPPYLR